jgi:hypothetical protein
MRETYVMRDGQLVPKSQAAPLQSGGAFLMPDIKPFVTQDGVEITSRSGLRAYEQAHGVRQVGNDYATLHRELRQKVRGHD